MQYADIPGKLPIPFANGAGAGYKRSIPVASQIGIVDGAASLTDGFPPLNFQTIAAGGKPPDGRDMNGILNAISAWTRWSAAGGVARFDSAFATAIGGYPAGALLASATSAGLYWANVADNNSTDPDGGSAANWIALASPLPASIPEVAAGTNNAKFVTPYSLAGVPHIVEESLGSNGYIKWSSGRIEQWGRVTTPASSETQLGASFATSFLNNVWNVSVTKHVASATTSSDFTLEVIQSSITLDGFSVQVQSGSPSWGNSGNGFSWRAIGN